MSIEITGVTVSVEFGFDQDFGRGTKSFANVSGKYPDHGKPLSSVDEVIEDGIDMYFAAWKTVLASRFTTGVINREEFTRILASSTLRLDKIKRFLKKTDAEWAAEVIADLKAAAEAKAAEAESQGKQ
jgi:hypothetical protein